MNTALFAFRKEALPQQSNLPNKDELFSKIRARDIKPIISLNAESAFDEHSVQAHELVEEFTTRPAGRIALSSVGVIANRLDRSFKQDNMPRPWVDATRPTINENTMRSLAFRKDRVQREVLDQLNLGMPTRLIEHVTDIALFVTEYPSDEYIVKPNSGTNSRGVATVSAEEAIGMYVDGLPEKQMIIQQKFDFSLPFNTGVRPYDALSQEAFDGWSKSDAVKEIRMYAFYSPTILSTFPVARAMQGGQEHWFFVDPVSLPEKITEDTKKTVGRAAEVTGSRAVMAALDFGYGRHVDTHEPNYHIIELNAKMPYVIGYDKHPHVADTLREHMADQIKDTVENQ